MLEQFLDGNGQIVVAQKRGKIDTRSLFCHTITDVATTVTTVQKDSQLARPRDLGKTEGL